MTDRVYDGALLNEVYVVLDIASETKDMSASKHEAALRVREARQWSKRKSKNLGHMMLDSAGTPGQ